MYCTFEALTTGAWEGFYEEQQGIWPSIPLFSSLGFCTSCPSFILRMKYEGTVTTVYMYLWQNAEQGWSQIKKKDVLQTEGKGEVTQPWWGGGGRGVPGLAEGDSPRTYLKQGVRQWAACSRDPSRYGGLIKTCASIGYSSVL